MKCEICGRQYVALGVHLRHKHQVDPDDYRDQYGILRVQPLVDEDLSTHLSIQAARRLDDDEYRAEVQDRCRVNAEKNKGKPSPGMSQAGKEKLARRNKEANDAYLKKMAPNVAKILDEKKTIVDVFRDIGMGPNAVKKIVAMGEATYSKDVAAVVRTQRAVASRLENKVRHDN